MAAEEYTLDDSPEGGIYCFSKDVSYVSIADFDRVFQHTHKVETGVLVSDVKKCIVGKCTKLGKRYKKRGTWVTLNLRGKNHFSPSTSCVPVPNCNSFYRNKKTKVWYSVYSMDNKMIQLQKVMLPADASDSDSSAPAKEQVDKLFSDSDSDKEDEGKGKGEGGSRDSAEHGVHDDVDENGNVIATVAEKQTRARRAKRAKAAAAGTSYTCTNALIRAQMHLYIQLHREE